MCWQGTRAPCQAWPSAPHSRCWPHAAGTSERLLPRAQLVVIFVSPWCVPWCIACQLSMVEPYVAGFVLRPMQVITVRCAMAQLGGLCAPETCNGRSHCQHQALTPHCCCCCCLAGRCAPGTCTTTRASWRCCSTATTCWRWRGGLTASSWPAPRWTARSTSGTHRWAIWAYGGCLDCLLAGAAGLHAL